MLAKAYESRTHAVIGFSAFETREIERAEREIAKVLGGGARVEPLRKQDEFAMRVQIASFGQTVLAKAEIANCNFTRATAGLINITVPLEGVLVRRSGAREDELRPLRQASVSRPFERVNHRWVEGSGVAFYAQSAVLFERAERLTGRSYGAALASHMVDSIDLTTPVGCALARNMKVAMAEIGSLDGLGIGALAASAYEDLLLNLAVVCLFPDVASILGPAPVDCGPATIRRARDYLREHAGEPVELSRLASDLGISMRAMQENFQRYFGFSPRDYLLQCRLELARRRLEMPGRAHTVAGIALDCGFGDLSHFASKYRAKFGELPSVTLRAARRQL